MNTFKSTLLLVSLTLILVLAGDWIGGQNGMVFAFLLSAVMNFVAYFYSDKIALGIYRAQPVTREQLPRAYQAVERLAAQDLCNSHRLAQRLRHRPQPPARFRRRHPRHPRPAQ